MDLPTAGREYAKFPLPAGVAMNADLSVSFDRGKTWHPLTVPDAHTAMVLVAGPTAENNPQGTVVLAPGNNRALVRLKATPENVVRSAGSIYVTG